MKKFKITDKDKQYVFNDNGVESVIFYYDGDKDKLLKYYRDASVNEVQKERDIRQYDFPRKTEEFPKEGLRIKEKKIELIPTLRSLEDEVQILGGAYEDNEFKGYVMKRENLKHLDPLPDSVFKSSEHNKKKIAYLKLIRDKIQKLNAEGIFIGDFNENNFLTDKDVSLVKLCDLDNLRIGDLDFDTRHRFVKMFETTKANPEFIDSFCFNMFTLAYLGKINSGYFMLKDLDRLPRPIRTKENEDIFDSMKNLDSSYQPKYLIDNLR